MLGDKDGKKIVDDAFWWGMNCAGWSETPLETVSRAEQPTITDAHGPTSLQGDDYPLTYDADGYQSCRPVSDRRPWSPLAKAA